MHRRGARGAERLARSSFSRAPRDWRRAPRVRGPSREPPSVALCYPLVTYRHISIYFPRITLASQAEMTALLQDLKILSRDSSKDQEFMAHQFAVTDQNGDGTVTFEEFKVRPAAVSPGRFRDPRNPTPRLLRRSEPGFSPPGPRGGAPGPPVPRTWRIPDAPPSPPRPRQTFYNAAIDYKRQGGRKRPRAAKRASLSPAVEAARKEATRRRAEEKAAADARLAAENRERKHRLSMARSRGRDAKALTPELEDARSAIAARKAREKAELEQRMAQENAEMRARIELHHSRGRDARALTPEIEEARAAVRRKSLADKAETERASRRRTRRCAGLAESMTRGRGEALTPEMEEARAAVRRVPRRQGRDGAPPRGENAEMRRRIAGSMAHGRDAR